MPRVVCIHPHPTSVPGETGKIRLGIGGHALVPGSPEHWTVQPYTEISAKVHHMITMHARPRHADRRTDEHHGSSATIRSTNALCANNI